MPVFKSGGCEFESHQGRSRVRTVLMETFQIENSAPPLYIYLTVNKFWSELEISNLHPYKSPQAFARFNQRGWKIIVRGSLHSIGSHHDFIYDTEELCYWALEKYYGGDALECYFSRHKDSDIWGKVMQRAEELWVVPYIMTI